MKMKAITATLFLGLSCSIIGACKSTPVLPTESHEPDCKLANRTMIALENNDSKAIDTASNLMSCYDGANAERVDVALSNMITNHPKSILAAMHKYNFDKATINGIVNTQPWKLVDKPCRFAILLKKREGIISNVNVYPEESKIALASLANFIPVVSANCDAKLSGK